MSGNLWDEPLDPHESYFSNLLQNEKYKLVIRDINRPEEQTMNKGKNRDYEYYMFEVEPLEDYKISNLYKDIVVKQHFPKKSFRGALSEYLGRDSSTIRELQRRRDECVDVEMVIERQQKTMTIHSMKIRG